MLYKLLKRFIFALFVSLVVLLVFFLNYASGADLEPTDVVYTPDLVGKEHYIPVMEQFAEKYQVSYLEMERIMDCENKDYDPKKQSGHRYTAGQIARNPSWGEVKDREKSFGLVQIHLPAGHTWQGKTITKEMAQDPILSIEFLAMNLSKGNGSWWSCY